MSSSCLISIFLKFLHFSYLFIYFLLYLKFRIPLRRLSSAAAAVAVEPQRRSAPAPECAPY